MFNTNIKNHASTMSHLFLYSSLLFSSPLHVVTYGCVIFVNICDSVSVSLRLYIKLNILQYTLTFKNNQCKLNKNLLFFLFLPIFIVIYVPALVSFLALPCTATLSLALMLALIVLLLVAPCLLFISLYRKRTVH